MPTSKISDFQSDSVNPGMRECRQVTEFRREKTSAAIP
jgi:hypothetical protein